MTLRIGFKTSPQDVDWSTLDATWRRAGEQASGPDGGWDSGWMNDHLTNMDPDAPGPSLEALTLLATLVHHVPGMQVGHAVLSNTFRHPVVLAKSAVVLDHATRGDFVLGLGAGWFEAEHEPFGLDLPPIGRRIDRLVSAVETLRLLWSAAASSPPGVSRDDPYYPLRAAVNAPAPFTPGGPRFYLGGQGPRGIRLVARVGAGWIQPGVNAGDAAYLAEKRDAIVAALEAEGRNPSDFDIVGQVAAGSTAASRREAVAAARSMARVGATHIVVQLPAALGPDGLDTLAAECLRPLRDAFA